MPVAAETMLVAMRALRVVEAIGGGDSADREAPRAQAVIYCVV